MRVGTAPAGDRHQRSLGLALGGEEGIFFLLVEDPERGWVVPGRQMSLAGWLEFACVRSYWMCMHTYTVFLGKVPTANAGCGAHHLWCSTGSSEEVRSQIKVG